MSRSPFNIKGGVTPLKKGEKGAGSGKSRARKQHAGDVGKKATATRAQDKSGYSRSGADFINVHSFTANTRLSPSLANTLGPSISSAVGGKTNQSKTHTDIVEDLTTGYDYENDPDQVLTKETHVGSWDYENDGMPTYDQAWDLNLENIHSIYKDKADYIKRRTDPDRKKNPDYKRPEYKEGGSYVTETVKGEHRRRPYKVVNGKKEFTGPWEVYTP